MKIAGLGDLHLRSTVPRHRTDCYPETLFNKFKYIIETCCKNNVRYLIQPGDFFTSTNISWDLFRHTASLLSSVKDKLQIFVVYGQHDLRFHSKDTTNTPLRPLEDLGLVTRLSPVAPVLIGNVALWGSSWMEDPPKELNPKLVNIWATHQTVTDDDKLWPGAKDYSLAQHLLRKHPFNLIISGDNHKGFISRFGGRWLINCGSLGRTNIDQATHLPFFFVFDTKTKMVAKMRIPLQQPQKVLAVEAVKEAKRKEKELTQLIESLKSARLQKGFNYKAMAVEALKGMNDESLTNIMALIFLAAETVDRDLLADKTFKLVTVSEE
jgi:DNA repair exonuclease SbcCD nuclease subunit